MFQPVWQPALLLGSPTVFMHTAERRALAWEDANRFSALRRGMFTLGLLEQPRAENRMSLLRQDYLEDTIHTTIGAYIAAKVSCLVRLGGHIPLLPSINGENVWTRPKWAANLLHRVHVARFFSAYWAVGMTYYTTYNLLTGFMGFPVNERLNAQPQASLISVIPAALLYAALNPNQRPERMWVGRATPFIGRFFLSAVLGCGLAVFNSKRFADTSSWKELRPTGKDSFFDTLRENAPSADLVAEMPYIPFYKETRNSPGLPVRNPRYDPEYVEKAKAEVKRKVDALH